MFCCTRSSLFSPAVGAEAVLPRGERASHRSALSCCAAQALHGQAWLSDGLWNLSRPGVKAVSPALAGGFLTTGRPAKFIWRLFNDSHSDQCEVIDISLWFLIFISLVIIHVECLFMCFLAICMSSLEKCLSRSSPHVYHGLLPIFFSWVFWFIVLELHECLYIWGISPLSVMSCKYFLPVCRLSFCFAYGFLC